MTPCATRSFTTSTARAVDSSQLDGKRGVWIGTLSVSPATWNVRPCTVCSTRATWIERVLARGLDRGLPRVEEDVVGELQHEPPVARRDLELPRVDHRLELLDELLEERGPGLRRRLRLAQLLEARLRVVERLRERPLLLEHLVDVLAEAFELAPQLRVDRRLLVELRLQVVLAGRQVAELLVARLRLDLRGVELLVQLGDLGLVRLLPVERGGERGVGALRVGHRRVELPLGHAPDERRREDGGGREQKGLGGRHFGSSEARTPHR